MHTVIRNNLLPARFGQNIKNSEIQEMIDMVTAQKISNVFREKNDIFEGHNHTLHIDVRIIANNSNLLGANLYKVDVQRKTGEVTTIGEAFITLGAEAENLADNLVNALKRSMEEVKQSANSRYYFVAADNEN